MAVSVLDVINCHHLYLHLLLWKKSLFETAECELTHSWTSPARVCCPSCQVRQLFDELVVPLVLGHQKLATVLLGGRHAAKQQSASKEGLERLWQVGHADQVSCELDVTQSWLRFMFCDSADPVNAVDFLRSTVASATVPALLFMLLSMLS